MQQFLIRGENYVIVTDPSYTRTHLKIHSGEKSRLIRKVRRGCNNIATIPNPRRKSKNCSILKFIALQGNSNRWKKFFIYLLKIFRFT